MRGTRGVEEGASAPPLAAPSGGSPSEPSDETSCDEAGTTPVQDTTVNTHLPAPSSPICCLVN